MWGRFLILLLDHKLYENVVNRGMPEDCQLWNMAPCRLDPLYQYTRCIPEDWPLSVALLEPQTSHKGRHNSKPKMVRK